MIKVTISPRFDTFMTLNDLEQDLSAANLTHLLPTDRGARKNFYRTMRQAAESYGVTFEVLKESRRDIMWEINDDGKRKIGTYMVTYNIPFKGAIPKFAGSKSRSVNKGRTADERRRFIDICRVLDDCLYNPATNSYTFHLRVSEYMKSIADVIVPRETGAYQLDKTVKSWYYYLDDRYLPEIKALMEIYNKFNMQINWTEATE